MGGAAGHLTRLAQGGLSRFILPASPAHPGGRDADFLFVYYYAPGVHVITADGKVRMLKTEGLTSEDLGKILQIGGCAEDTLGHRVLFDDCERRLNWPNIAALAVWVLSVGMLLTKAVRSRKALSGSAAAIIALATCPTSTAGPLASTE